MASTRIRCDECETMFDQKDLLEAPNPFDEGDLIFGCPECREVNSTTLLCEVEGCPSIASCGTPVAGGYAQTCCKHKPA